MNSARESALVKVAAAAARVTRAGGSRCTCRWRVGGRGCGVEEAFWGAQDRLEAAASALLVMRFMLRSPLMSMYITCWEKRGGFHQSQGIGILGLG